MRLFVKITNTSQYGDYKKGDEGYIDGYCRAADDRAYAIVIIEKRLVMVDLFLIEVANEARITK